MTILEILKLPEAQLAFLALLLSMNISCGAGGSFQVKIFANAAARANRPNG